MMKGLQRWAITVILCFSIVYVLPAQRPAKTPIKQPSRTIRQPPTKVNQPIKVIVSPAEEEEKVPEKLQIDPPIDMMIDLEALNRPLSISQPYTRTLHDNSMYIDAYLIGRTFDITKKQDGKFALVYSASPESSSVRNKAVLFTLNSDLSQHGQAMIVTPPGDEVYDLHVKEFMGSILAIPYVCKDARCPDDYNKKALKYSQVNANGSVGNRIVDDAIGNYKIKAIFKNFDGDISLIYNLNGIGKVGLAGIYLGNGYMTCELEPLPEIETVYFGSDPNTTQPAIISASFTNDNFLLYTDTRLQAPVWDLEDKGLSSGRKSKPVWPLLAVDNYAVANSYQGQCKYDNDPYTVYTDDDLDLNDMTDAFLLSDGKLGVLEEDQDFTYFNVFDENLNRVHDHSGLAANILKGSIQKIDLGNQRILFLYKTNSNHKDQYRATLYDWNIHDILWPGSEILWEEDDWDDKIYRLIKLDDSRCLIVNLVEEEGQFTNHQPLEYRIITLNFPDE